MSTPHSIPRLAPRVRIGQGTVLTAAGALVAIAVTIVILTLTGAHQTTVALPATTSQAAGGAAPQVHYLGPRQTRAALAPTTSQSGVASGGLAARYACLGVAQRRCLR